MTEESATLGLWRSVRQGFTGWWAVAGILAASLTAFNLFRRIAQVGLSQLFSYLAAQWDAWIHLPIRWLVDWLHVPMPPAWTIDVAVLWLLIGGIVLRSAWGMRATNAHSGVTLASDFELWNFLCDHHWTLPFFILFCLLLWPVAMFFMVAAPLVHRYFASKDLEAGIIGQRYFRGEHFLYDLRVVLLAQAIATVAFVVVWIGANVATKLYLG